MENTLSAVQAFAHNGDGHPRAETMNDKAAIETLVHPELGELPARRLLDCVFALPAHGRMLHLHIEQLDVEPGADELRYVLTDRPARPERARCQVIPPFVPEFRRRA